MSRRSQAFLGRAVASWLSNVHFHYPFPMISDGVPGQTDRYGTGTACLLSR